VAPPSDHVTSLSLDELFRQADILSLHVPLSPESKHLVNADRLAQMKPTAIIVNTARGGLIDTTALANALQAGTIAAAGLDVFESEPLEEYHPLRKCPNALLTSHVAWFSERSVPKLQRMAAQEAVRALQGEPLRNQVNK
jgi:D-3-phosphoglycerate dehydrogenase